MLKLFAHIRALFTYGWCSVHLLEKRHWSSQREVRRGTVRWYCPRCYDKKCDRLERRDARRAYATKRTKEFFANVRGDNNV